MNTKLGHQLIGYDRRTEFVAVEYEIDPKIFKKIREIANVDRKDRDAVGAYALNPEQLRAISTLLGKKLETDRYDFFLEPVVV